MPISLDPTIKELWGIIGFFLFLLLWSLIMILHALKKREELDRELSQSSHNAKDLNNLRSDK